MASERLCMDVRLRHGWAIRVGGVVMLTLGRVHLASGIRVANLFFKLPRAEYRFGQRWRDAGPIGVTIERDD